MVLGYLLLRKWSFVRDRGRETKEKIWCPMGYLEVKISLSHRHRTIANGPVWLKNINAREVELKGGLMEKQFRYHVNIFVGHHKLSCTRKEDNCCKVLAISSFGFFCISSISVDMHVPAYLSPFHMLFAHDKSEIIEEWKTLSLSLCPCYKSISGYTFDIQMTKNHWPTLRIWTLSIRIYPFLLMIISFFLLGS